MAFCRLRNRGKVLLHVPLALGLLSGLSSFAQQAPTPWVVGQVLIAGTSVTVAPSRQSVPLNVGTIVNTKYGSGQGTPPAGYIILGDLEGPAFDETQNLSAFPNQPLQIPPLPVAGAYFLKNIRLMNGTAEVAVAEPSQVEIDASNVVISQVTSHPMTMEEIQQSGIILNTNDYKVFRYTVGLGLTSGTVNLDFPVLFSATDPTRPPIVLSKMGLPGPPPLPNVLPGSASETIPDLAGIDLAPVALTVDTGDNLDDPEVPALNLSGLLVFPNRITFLNQFFVVGLLLQNGAPAGSALQLDQMKATIHFPDGSEFVLKGTVPPMVNGAVPVRDPGPDGVLGTTDDVAVLAAGMQGQGEFQVTTPKSGTFTVDIEFDGTLLGLASGQTYPVKGHAAGIVVVRDPTYHVTFAHPAVVRQNEEYAIQVTLSNTSEVDANDVSLSLPSGQISGAALLSGQPSLVSLGTLHAGESKTAEFRLLALKTGQVTTSSIAGTGGTTGTVVLTTGVGEAGIPLSPDTLVLPQVVTEQLPSDVVTASLDFLGLGWSLATAPPNERPAGMTPVSEGQVKYRAQELTALARFAKISQSPDYTAQNALSELALKWLGNQSHDSGFDALRRLPADTFGPSKGMQLAGALGAHLAASGQNAATAHEAFARATRVLNAHFSAACDPTGASAAPAFWLDDGLGRRLGDAETSGLVRDVPWGESYPFGSGRLLAVGHLAGDESFTVHLDGQGGGMVDLSVLAPLAGGPSLIRFQGVQVAQGSKARVVFTPGATGLILENDLTEGGSYTQLQPTSTTPIALPPLAALGAIQDLMADTSGRAACVLFNRPVDKTSAEVLANYSLDTRTLLGAFLQTDGRVVEVRAHSAISPLVENHLTISGVLTADDHSAMSPASATLLLKTYLTGPAGNVTGTVFGEDGAPLAGAGVELWEEDKEDLFGDPIEHRTASTVTDGQGRFELDYVRMTGKNFSLEAVDPATGHSAKLKAAITFDQQVLDVALFMRARGSVRGTVHAPDGTPAVRALVTATEGSTGEWVQAFTDYYGHYLIEKLPVGTIHVAAHATGGPHADATAYLNTAGAVITVNLNLVDTPTGGVKGFVKNADGTPAAGAVAALTVNNDVYTSCFTGQDGTFQMGGILPGSYGFSVHEPVTFVPRINQTITVTGGQVLDVGTLIMPAATSGSGTITGHVYQPDGQSPVGGASVYISTPMGGVLAHSTADGSGAFSLSPVPIGTWSVSAYDPVTRKTASAQATIAFDGQTVGVSIYFPALGTVQGTVYKYLPGGSKVTAPGVAVHMGTLLGQTDASGHFQFLDVPLGEKRLIAVAGDPPTDVGKTTVQLSFEGQVLTADITMLGRGELKVQTLIPPQNGQPEQAVAAMVNVFTYQINAQDYSLDRVILTANSDATTGIVSFPDLLGTGVSATAQNGFNSAGSASTLVRAGLTTDLKVYLEQTGYIEGTVFAPDGITAVPHALVTLSVPGLPDRSVAADTYGHYDFDLVTKGSLTITAQDTSTGRWGTANGLLSNTAVALHLDVRLLGEGQVMGTVVEDNGQGGTVPAVNTQVTLKGLAPRPDRTATTDLLGQFVMDDVVEGDYSVEAVDPYHTFPLAGRTSVAVERGQTSQVSLRLGSFGTVTGTLFMPDGITPVPNAQITMNLDGSAQYSGYAVTDTQGRFIFSYVLAGAPFSLGAFDPRTGRSASGSGKITIANQVLEIPLKLSAIGTVSGHVTNHAETEPIANPTVTIHLGVTSLLTTGDEQGLYEFLGVPQGTFPVTATDPANGAKAEGAATIQSEGEAFSLDLHMPAFGRVDGTVLRPDGTTPVEGAIVTLDSSHVIGTDASGQFHFGGVALGTYWVKADDALSRDGGKTRVSVDEDQQVVQTSVRFLGLGTVTGIVKDASGNPVEGFQVTLTDTNDYTGMEGAGPTGTSASGSFEFHDQRVGQISVTAVAPYGSGDSRRGSASGVLASAGGTLQLEVSLGAAGSVRGRVVDEKSTPVVGALVTLAKTDGSGTWSAGTSSTGNFSFPVIPIGNSGAFSLTITGPWGGHARTTGALTQDGQVLNLGDITLDTVPSSAVTVPANQAVNVALDVTLSATFSEAIDPATVGYGNTVLLTRDDNGQLVPAVLTLAADNLSLTVQPGQNLVPQVAYTFKLTQGILDAAGNPMAAALLSHFTTLDSVPPVVATAYPANGASQIPVEVYPFVIFNEAIDPASLSQGTFTVTSQGGMVSGSVSLPEDKKILFSPNSSLSSGTAYAVNVAGFKDIAGNSMTPWAGSFVTLDTDPPAVSITGPTEAQAGNPAAFSITASDSGSLARIAYTVTGAITASGQKDYEVGTQNATLDMSIDVPASLSDGAIFTVQATATDATGQTGTSTPVSITAYHIPAITLISPADNAHVPKRGTVTAEAQVQPINGTVSVTFLLDGFPQATVTTPPFKSDIALPDLMVSQVTLTATATTGLGKSASTNPVTLNLDPSSKVTGHVYQAGGQNPEPRAKVKILDWNGNVLDEVSADVNGLYESGYIPLGNRKIQARKADGTDAASAAALLNSDGATVTKDLTLVGTGTITGRVVDSNTGQNLANARIEFTGSSVLPQSATVQSASDGIFNFPDVLVGGFRILIYHPSNNQLGAQINDSLSSPGQTMSYDPIVCFPDAALVTAMYPPNGASEVDAATPVTITFSQPVNASSLASGIDVYYYALPFGTSANIIYESWTLSTDGLTATMASPSALYPASRYDIRVSGVSASSGRGVLFAESVFTTHTPPQPVGITFLDRVTGVVLGTTTPPQDSRSVAQNAKIQVQFDAEIAPSSVRDDLLALHPSSGMNLLGTVSLLSDKKTLEFVPTEPIPGDSLFVLGLWPGLADLQGHSWPYRTDLGNIYTVDTLAPIAQILSPPDGAFVLDGATLPIFTLNKDGANYCATTTTVTSVNGTQQDSWTGTDCLPRWQSVRLPAATGQPATVTQTVTDLGNQSSAATATLNPVAMTLGANLPLDGSVNAFAALGDRVFLTAGATVTIYGVDSVNLGAPQLLGSFTAPATVRAMAALPRYLWLTTDGGQLAGYDVSDPANVTPVGAIALGGCASSCYPSFLVTSGGYAFVAYNKYIVHVISLDVPSAPLLVSSIVLTPADYDNAILDLQVDGPRMAARVWNRYWSGASYQYYSWVKLYDVTDPRTPNLLFDDFAQFGNDRSTSGFRLEGDTLYLSFAWAQGQGNLSTVDISAPTAPVLVGTGYTTPLGPGLRSGDMLLASGLHGWMVADPANPYDAGSPQAPVVSHFGRTGEVVTVVDTTASPSLLRSLRLNLRNHGTSLSITSPGDGASQRGGSILPVQVSPNAGFNGVVTLWVDGQAVEERDHAPYSFRYWLPCSSPGTKTFEATLRDDSGNVIHSTLVNVYVTSCDATPPTVATTSPADQATGVLPSATLSANFSEPVASASINSTSVQLVRDGNAWPDSAEVSVSEDGLTVTLDPSSDLLESTAYTFQLAGTIKDLAGNPMGQDVLVHFTTADLPPVVTLFHPTDGEGVIGGDGLLSWDVASDQSIVDSKLLIDGQMAGDAYQFVIPLMARAFGTPVTFQIQVTDTMGLTGSSPLVTAKALFDADYADIKDLADLQDPVIAATDSRLAIGDLTVRLYSRSDLDNPVAEAQCPAGKVVFAGDTAVALVPYGDPCPFVPASNDTPGGILSFAGADLAADGNLLAVLTGAGFQLFDVRTPGQPAMLADVDISSHVPYPPARAWLGGKSLVVETCGNGECTPNFALYDLSDPAQPAFQASMEGWISDAVLIGNSFVTTRNCPGQAADANPEDLIHIYDLGASAPFALAGSIPDCSSHLRVLGDHLLLLDGGIYDLGQPSSPAFVCAIRPGGFLDLGPSDDEKAASVGSELLWVHSWCDEGSGCNTKLARTRLTVLDPAAPSVSFIEPGEGATVNTTSRWWTVKADVSDNAGVAWVDLLIEGQTVRRKTSGPWDFLLPLDVNLVGQSITAELRVTDLAGNFSSAARTVRFGTEIVGVRITPSGTASWPAGGSLEIAADAIMVGGVERVEFTVNGTPFCTASQRPFTCHLTTGASQAGQTLVVDATAYHGADTVTTIGGGGSLTLQLHAPSPNEVLDAWNLASAQWWMQLSPDGALTVISGDNGASIYTTGLWSSPIRTFPGKYLDFIRPDGETALMDTWEDGPPAKDTLFLVSLSTGSVLGSYVLEGGGWGPSSPDGKTLAILDSDQNVRLLDLDSMTAQTCCSLQGMFTSPSWLGWRYLPDGRAILLLVRDAFADNTVAYKLLQLDVATGQWSSNTLDLPGTYYYSFQLTPDGTKAWIFGNASKVFMVDLATWQMAEVDGLPLDTWWYPVFHPSGTFCSTTLYNANSVLDLTVDPLAVIPGHTVAINKPDQLLFEPAGRWSYVLSGEDAKLYRLYVSEADTWPPKFVSSIPSDGGSASADGPVNVYLSEPMDLSTINGATVTVTELSSGTAVGGTAEAPHLGTVVKWTPLQPLGTGDYILNLTGLKDTAGNDLPPKTLAFRIPG